MNRMLLGAVMALALAGLGLFWLQGRAQVERAAPPPDAPAPGGAAAGPDGLPHADVAGLLGPAPPEATELTREQRRFYRYDRNRDGRIARNEMLSTRTGAFRKLDADGNNLLTFEEWAASTSRRFAELDTNGDGFHSPDEFAAGAPPPGPARSGAPRCDC